MEKLSALPRNKGTLGQGIPKLISGDYSSEMNVQHAKMAAKKVIHAKKVVGQVFLALHATMEVIR